MTTCDRLADDYMHVRKPKVCQYVCECVCVSVCMCVCAHVCVCACVCVLSASHENY